MNALYKPLTTLAVVALLLSACGTLPAPEYGQSERVRSNTANYETLIDKPLADEIVGDFLAANNCSSANQFLLCKTAGVALWTDSNQVIETVYLYLNNEDGFAAYQGELPFGLKFYDTMASVEYKLKRQGVDNDGLPDEGVTPDHMHYQATYYQAGMTIIYNFPFPDEGASINAIVIMNKKRPR